MSNYFSHFPKTTYDISGNGLSDSAVDICRRFAIKFVVDKRVIEIYTYVIRDGDRPDIIAAKYYGSSKYDWIVMMINNIYDVNYDWPLTQQNFKQFIISKYGTVAAAQAAVHHYEQIIRAEQWNATGLHLPELVVEVDLTTYTALGTSDRKSVTSYTYEKELNDSKRTINIIDEKYVDEIVAKARTMFDNG